MTAEERPQPSASLLLVAIDALVRGDLGPSGLRGTVAIGVREDESTTWWCAAMSRTAEATFVNERPKAFDVAVELTRDAATALLRCGPLDRTGVVVTGDAGLFADMIERYVTRRTPLQMRVGEAREPRR